MTFQPIECIELSRYCIDNLFRYAKKYTIEISAVVLGKLYNKDGKTIAKADIVILTDNAENSSTRFSIDIEVLYGIYQYSEHVKKDIIAIFHSHPHNDSPQPPQPSSIDLQFMRYNPCVWLIAGRIHTPAPVVSAYQLVGDEVKKVSLRIVD
ncbi:MAG: Mov34/MPN/PAD-1 family protein [Candidatus Ranarchaeia archaeon]